MSKVYYPWEAGEMPQWVEIVIKGGAEYGLKLLELYVAKRLGNEIFKHKVVHIYLKNHVNEFIHEYRDELWDFFNSMAYYSTPQGRIEFRRGTSQEQIDLKSKIGKQLADHIYNEHHPANKRW